MRYSLGSLRTFAMVAEMGSLTEAAERLGRTPSTVSLSLKTLEAEVGVPLFESERKNRLSAAGQMVLAQARDLLSHHERAVASIRAFARNQTGRVDLACVPSIATAILPAMLPAFRRSHPGVEINVRDADSPTVAEAVEKGKVAFGVASLPRARPELRFEPLFTERLGIVCRSDDPLARHALPLSWRDLQDRTFLSNGISSLTGAPTLAELISEAPIVVHNVLSLVALVRAGLGITALPYLSIAPWEEGLAFLPLEDTSASRTVGLLTRSAERNSPATDVFIAELRDTIRARADDLGILEAGSDRKA